MLTINVKKQLAKFQFEFKQDFASQGITAILGVSGSGKSTLISLINGLIKPDYGQIKLNEHVLVDTQSNIFISPAKRHIATIFQDPLLFPHLKVSKNLTYGMPEKMRIKFAELIDVLNIGHLLNRYPAMLSGGEKQRVAIGRALLSDPQLLLMDEPLSALDMPRKNELISYINKLVEELNIPIVYVTHNINEVKRLAHHVAIIEQGQQYHFGPTATILASDYLKNWV